MYKIIVTEPAQNDLNDAFSYIANELKNTQAAINLLNSVEKAGLSLQDLPERYSLVNDDFLAKEGFRFVPIKNYLLFYAVRKKTKTVVIQRFLYARRDWESILKTNSSAEKSEAEL